MTKHFYQRYALEIADEYETTVEDAIFDYSGKPFKDDRVSDALRGQHAEIEQLKAEVERLTPSNDLKTFLDIAAGEGYVFGGVDAGDLYLKYFPDAYKDKE